MSGNSNDEDEDKILGFNRKDYEAMAMSNLKVSFLFNIKVEELVKIQHGGSIDLKCRQILLCGKRKGQKGLAYVHIDARTKCTLDKHIETRRVLGDDYLMSCHFKNGMYKIDGPTIASFNPFKDPTDISVTVVKPAENKVLLDLIKQHEIEIR